MQAQQLVWLSLLQLMSAHAPHNPYFPASLARYPSPQQGVAGMGQHPGGGTRMVKGASQAKAGPALQAKAAPPPRASAPAAVKVEAAAGGGAVVVVQQEQDRVLPVAPGRVLSVTRSPPRSPSEEEVEGAEEEALLRGRETPLSPKCPQRARDEAAAPSHLPSSAGVVAGLQGLQGGEVGAPSTSSAAELLSLLGGKPGPAMTMAQAVAAAPGTVGAVRAGGAGGGQGQGEVAVKREE